jgi:hypothetical protein
MSESEVAASIAHPDIRLHPTPLQWLAYLHLPDTHFAQGQLAAAWVTREMVTDASEISEDRWEDGQLTVVAEDACCCLGHYLVLDYGEVPDPGQGLIYPQDLGQELRDSGTPIGCAHWLHISSEYTAVGIGAHQDKLAELNDDTTCDAADRLANITEYVLEKILPAYVFNLI